MGPYSIVVADPPWRFNPYDRATGLDRAPDAHYETMPTDDICRIPVGEWVAKDSLLVMWVYDPMLPDALKVANAWGFEFVTVLFRWLKTDEHRSQLALFEIEPSLTPMGNGYHTRAGGCEEAWLFKRGKGCRVLRHDIRREFFAQVREHSRKPDEAAEKIVELYGDLPRLEMFARTRRPGWDVWGNEVTKFATRLPSYDPDLEVPPFLLRAP